MGPALGGGVYWTDRGAGRLMRMNFDGSAPAALDLTGEFTLAGSNVRGIAVDIAGERLFWADNGSETLRTAALDGSGAKILVTLTGTSPFPADVRPNFAAGQLWWCDQAGRTIQRAAFDGTGVTTVIADAAPTGAYFLDFDLKRGQVYWGDFSGGAIFRSRLDGSQRETVLTGNSQTRGVGVDAEGGFLYWVNRDGKSIHRCPLAAFASGPITLAHPAVETVYHGLDTPHGLVLDLPAGKLYWADTGTNAGDGFGGRSVCRGDLDGSSPAEVLASGTEPWDVDLDPRCTTYTEWRMRFFRRDAPESATSPVADPDADGRPNELEYLIGSSPRASDADSRWLAADMPKQLGAPLRLSFPVNSSARDFELVLEMSESPANWSESKTVLPVSMADEPMAAGISRRTVTLASDMAAQLSLFLRLRAVPLP